MKVTPQHSPSFGNIAVSEAMRFLSTDPAWGAVAVDLASMTIPRTAVDMKKRGPILGAETALREGSCTANVALVGTYGMLSGFLLSGAINKNYDIKAHKIFASGSFIDEFGKAFKSSNCCPDTTLRKVLDSVKTFDKNITKEARDAVVALYEKTDMDSKTAVKELKAAAKAHIIRDTGSESNFKFGKHAVSLDAFLDNTFSLLKTFKSEKVTEAFNAADGGKHFLKSLKRTGLSRSILGLAIGGALGMSIQPLNAYITKKRTGRDGFACADGRKKDNSAGFNALKAGAAVTGLGAALFNIGRPLADKLEFKSGIPTLDQFKFIYGLTIASRLLAARDKDELRETAVRDTIGFTSWLMLGNFVQKGVTKLLDGSLVKSDKTLVSRDEIVQGAMKNLKKETVIEGKAMKFADMLKVLKNSEDDVAKTALRQLCKVNVAQVAGYVFSCVMLGNLLPRFNIAMTKKSEAKRREQLPAVAYNAMLLPENLNFLSKNL